MKFALLLLAPWFVQAAETPYKVTGVSVSKDCSTVEVSVVADVPVELKVEPVVYNHQPEYWLHEISATPDTRAFCPTDGCSAKISFDYLSRGTLGIEIPSSPRGPAIQLPTNWTACSK